VSAHFARVTELHKDFLEHQSAAQARFLSALAASALPPPPAPTQPPPPASAEPGRPLFDRADLERLAAGHVAELFGPPFGALAGRRRLTRLPTPPMLLVDRVTGLDATPASMGTGTIGSASTFAKATACTACSAAS
jgi:hypothetical protein